MNYSGVLQLQGFNERQHGVRILQKTGLSRRVRKFQPYTMLVVERKNCNGNLHIVRIVAAAFHTTHGPTISACGRDHTLS